MARTRALVSVALVLALAACGGDSKPAATAGRSTGGAGSASEPAAAACPGTRVAKPALVALALRADGLAPCWTAFGGANNAVTAVDGQTVMVSSTPCTDRSDGSSDLIALDTATGKELWRVNGAGVPAENEEHGVRAAGDHVLMSAGESSMQARDTRTGKVLWELANAGAVADGPDFVVASVGIDVDTTYLVADRRTGKERWHVNRAFGGSSAVVADATSVLIDDDGESGETTAYDATTGHRRWTAAFHLNDTGGRGEDLKPSIVVDGVVIGLDGPRTRGRDIKTGRLLWTSNVSLDLGANEITGGRVVVYLPDESAGVLDVRTGKTLWTTKDALLLPGPAVLLGWSERGFSGLDLTTGKELWTVISSQLNTLPDRGSDTGQEPVGPELASMVVSSDRVFLSYLNCPPGENE
jgi:outer membrane protein assembly factor BamB